VLSSVLFFPPLFSFLFFFFPAVLLDEFDLEKELNRQKRERRTESGTGVGSGGLTFRLPFRIAPFPTACRTSSLSPARSLFRSARAFVLPFLFIRVFVYCWSALDLERKSSARF
jgi:hypothetical protein